MQNRTKRTYRMTMLFDFYGELLTARQKEFFDLYYNEDFSLAEIAENSGITRQGVRDVLVRATAAMQRMEDKTGIIRRFEDQRDRLRRVGTAVSEVRDINAHVYRDRRVADLTEQIAEELRLLQDT